MFISNCVVKDLLFPRPAPKKKKKKRKKERKKEKKRRKERRKERKKEEQGEKEQEPNKCARDVSNTNEFEAVSACAF